MRKWFSMFFLTLLAKLVMAQSNDEIETSSSPTGAIIIGVLLLVVVIFMLYNRQKRKYND